jgi:hypothetical protein
VFHPFALSGRCQLFAITVEVERMIGDVKIEDVSCRILDLLNSWIAEFEYLPAVLTDEMIVLGVLVGTFKMGNVLAELMFGNKFTIQQELDGVVKCSAAYTVVLVFHLHIQRFNVEMTIAAVHFAEYGKSFGSFPMTVVSKVIGEDLLYVLEYFRFRFRKHCSD